MKKDLPGTLRYASAFLVPFSWLYGIAAWLRKKTLSASAVYRPPARTVSVGNITAGGTGKSPLVELICENLVSRGIRPAVVRRNRSAWPFRNDLRDEEAVFAEKLPGVSQFCGSDKAECARIASESKPDIIVVDDAFQTLKLHRDADIVTLDSTDPFGNGFLLPAGRLREHPCALNRADAIVLLRAGELDFEQKGILSAVIRRWTNAPIFEAGYVPEAVIDINTGSHFGLSSLKGRKIYAFCGIGSPGSFFSTVERLGAIVDPKTVFPDHHAYTVSDIGKLLARKKSSGVDMLITTQKDAVKIRQLVPAGAEISYLKIRLELTNLDRLLQLVTGEQDLSEHGKACLANGLRG